MTQLGKVKHGLQTAHGLQTVSVARSDKEVVPPPPLDGMLAHCTLPLQIATGTHYLVFSSF